MSNVVRLICPNLKCRKVLSVPDSARGKKVRCRGCGQQSEIASRWSLCCPQCESADVEVVHGNEFLVTSLDVT